MSLLLPKTGAYTNRKREAPHVKLIYSLDYDSIIGKTRMEDNLSKAKGKKEKEKLKNQTKGKKLLRTKETQRVKESDK